MHMFRPFDDFVFSGDEVGNGFLGIVGVAGLEKTGDPVDCVFDGPGDVAEHYCEGKGGDGD